MWYSVNYWYIMVIVYYINDWEDIAMTIRNNGNNNIRHDGTERRSKNENFSRKPPHKPSKPKTGGSTKS